MNKFAKKRSSYYLEASKLLTMKKFLVATIVMSFVISFTSCEKDKEWSKKESKDDYYYSTDYKEAEGQVLSQDISDIDVLYSVFFYEHKVLKYKLVAEEKGNESENCFGKCSNDVLAWEEGQADVDDNLNITFIPDNNPEGRYYGYFENEKKNYKVTIPGVDSRELTFNLK